jgi:acetylornithine deacetylase/succinyl-diaminopimelate desuccinylase-like protein
MGSNDDHTGAGVGGHGAADSSTRGGDRSSAGVAAVSAGSGGSGAAPGSGGAAAGGAKLDPEISTMVAAVDATQIGGRIQTLSEFTTRNTCSDDTSAGKSIGAAREWIRQQLLAAGGLTVGLDPFTVSCGMGSVTRENVVAVKPGTHPDRVIIIGGHYDSRTYGGTDPTDPAPGANDSGSQTSLVLEAARVMAGHTFDATILFVAFAGEEQGLFGSKHLAANYAQYTSAKASVEAMLNCDIVGGDNTVNDAAALQQFRLYSAGTPPETGSADGTTDDTSPSRGVMRYIATWGSAYVPSMTSAPELRVDRPGRGGDQESFLSAGIPSVRFMDLVETCAGGEQGVQDPTTCHQHSPYDLAQYVTPDHAADMSRVVIAVAASLARAPAAPKLAAATGSESGPWTLTFAPPTTGPAVDHYVVAARATTENFYRTRVVVPAGGTAASISADALGIAGVPSFYISIGAVDAAGHESLFAYPEYRCTATGCVVPG